MATGRGRDDSAGPNGRGVHGARGRTRPDLEQQISCPGDLGPSAECTEVTDAGGRHVGRTSGMAMGRVVVHEAVVVGPGDGVVHVAVAGSTDQKWSAGSTIDGPEPPLPVAQLVDLAGDPARTS